MSKGKTSVTSGQTKLLNAIRTHSIAILLYKK